MQIQQTDKILTPASLSGTLAAAEDTLSYEPLGVSGMIAIEVASGLTGTIVFEGSMDDGSSWFGLEAINIATGVKVASVNSFPFRGLLIYPGVGFIRMRVSIYTSGSAIARFQATSLGQQPQWIRPTGQQAMAESLGVTIASDQSAIPSTATPSPHAALVTTRANYTAAQTDTAIVTIATGLRIVVTRCSVLADNANTVDVQARIGFAAATTPTGDGVVLSHPGIAAGSGVVEGNGSGVLGAGADGEDLRITAEVPTGGSIDVVVTYYTEAI